MIQAVITPAHKQAFATAIQGAPYFRAVMGRDLALWADNPGAPVRLFTLPGAALTLNGSTAQLCGTPQDWEELLSFLQFAGIAHLIAEETPLLPAAAGEPLFLYSMPPQDRLPLAQEHQGYMLNRSPSVLRLATQLFPQEPERQDCYYSETCPRLCPCAGFAGCSRPPGEHCGGLCHGQRRSLYGNGGNPAGAARAGHRRLADSLPGQRAGRGGLDRDIFVRGRALPFL